jgi:hypothetical protein
VGGFVISRGPLAELVPVENAAMEGRTVIQWDKDDLETLGLLKVDVLALGMLSAIRRSLPSSLARPALCDGRHSREDRRSTTCCAPPTRWACSRSNPAPR